MRRSTPIVSVALALSLVGPAQAAEWLVDPAKSRLAFSGTQTGAAFTGQFTHWTAAIDFDPAKPAAAHLRVVVDVASAATGDAQKDEAMPGEDWFNAAQFAQATFEATGFAPKGGDAYETAGKLTLRGLSKDFTMPFTLTIAADQAHAIGAVKLVRTDFGVGAGSWSTGDTVGLDVDVRFDLTATRKAGG